MVDVSSKVPSKRTAHARCFMILPPALVNLLNGNEIQSAKGPVFATAIIAGTMAVKKTSDLIPFCHPLAIENCKINIQFNQEKLSLQIDCVVTITGKTGVEMEALVGCNIAALTVYDMCKAITHDMIISECKLISKTGGKSDISPK